MYNLCLINERIKTCKQKRICTDSAIRYLHHIISLWYFRSNPIPSPTNKESSICHLRYNEIKVVKKYANGFNFPLTFPQAFSQAGDGQALHICASWAGGLYLHHPFQNVMYQWRFGNGRVIYIHNLVTSSGNSMSVGFLTYHNLPDPPVLSSIGVPRVRVTRFALINIHVGGKWQLLVCVCMLILLCLPYGYVIALRVACFVYVCMIPRRSERTHDHLGTPHSYISFFYTLIFCQQIGSFAFVFLHSFRGISLSHHFTSRYDVKAYDWNDMVLLFFQQKRVSLSVKIIAYIILCRLSFAFTAALYIKIIRIEI